jgi:hypothetical protein
VFIISKGRGVTVKNGGRRGVTITLNDPGSNEFTNPLFIYTDIENVPAVCVFGGLIVNVIPEQVTNVGGVPETLNATT